MKTYKCLKAIKKNSQTNDGHPDGTELLIFAEKTIDEEVKKQAEEAGIPIADKIYYALIKNSQDFELMEYLPTAILDFKTDIISDELVDFKTEDETALSGTGDDHSGVFFHCMGHAGCKRCVRGRIPSY